jgi:hypothetical protein
MYKRPSRCVRNLGYEHRPAPVDSFLYKLMNPSPIQYPVKVLRPIYQQDLYLRLFKENQKVMGITYVDQQLPILPPTVYPEPRKEPELTYGDSVQVVLRVLKNGIVRVKVNGAIADMYAKYYGPGVDHSKVAPFKAVLQAYKAHGFSKEFLDRITKNNDKRKAIQIRIDKVFTTIFDKEPVKKAKKEKKKKVEEIEEVITEAVEPEEDADKPLAPDAPEEDETLDVEPDEDEEEEEYVSDGE